LGKLDLMTTAEKSIQLGQYIPISRAGLIHGVAGWFSVTLSGGIKINTAPDKPTTHWKQAFFPFQNPVRVIAGDVLDWKVKVNEKELNSDDTRISYEYRCTQLINESAVNPGLEMRDKSTGRNELCPCGSGKKFKKCCMA